MKKTTTQKPPF